MDKHPQGELALGIGGGGSYMNRVRILDLPRHRPARPHHRLQRHPARHEKEHALQRPLPGEDRDRPTVSVLAIPPLPWALPLASTLAHLLIVLPHYGIAGLVTVFLLKELLLLLDLSRILVP